ncbi:MAG TPA: DUF6249 domain-containing protein [Ktedonosporobacter sp.]|nr:DUF6249 domain-containing protein [Ktedonosporobacter sp.]
MSATVITVLIGWLLALAIFFGFIILLRYIEHRERMALITRGINPDQVQKQRRGGLLRAGLITMMVGITLTAGLYPVGFLLPLAFTATPLHLGPWLLPGLIPFGVGMALTVSYYLEPRSTTVPPAEAKKDEKVIPLKDHLDKERHG